MSDPFPNSAVTVASAGPAVPMVSRPNDVDVFGGELQNLLQGLNLADASSTSNSNRESLTLSQGSPKVAAAKKTPVRSRSERNEIIIPLPSDREDSSVQRLNLNWGNEREFWNEKIVNGHSALNPTLAASDQKTQALRSVKPSSLNDLPVSAIVEDKGASEALCAFADF